MRVVRASESLGTALLVALLAACGGGTTPTQRPAATQPPTGSTEGPVAPATQGPVSGPTQAPPGGGQGISNFCLNTNDEVSQALRVAVARSEGNENPGFGGGCIYYDASGALVYSIGFVPVVPGMPDLVATGLQTPGAVAVAGIGEGAVLMSAQGPLVYKKGTWIVSTGGAPTLAIASDAAAYSAAMQQLAQAGSTRF